MSKERYQKRKEDNAAHQQNIRDRRQTNNGTSYRTLHDLVKSDFFQTTKQTLKNNQKKEYLQKQFNNTIDNLENKKLDDFAKQF